MSGSPTSIAPTNSSVAGRRPREDARSQQRFETVNVVRSPTALAAVSSLGSRAARNIIWSFATCLRDSGGAAAAMSSAKRSAACVSPAPSVGRCRPDGSSPVLLHPGCASASRDGQPRGQHPGLRPRHRRPGRAAVGTHLLLGRSSPEQSWEVAMPSTPVRQGRLHALSGPGAGQDGARAVPGPYLPPERGSGARRGDDRVYRPVDISLGGTPA
jgi:hypothetical protein